MSFDAVMPPYNANDPTATFLSSSCLDLLLIELVPMAYRVTNELEAASSNGGLSAAAAAAASAQPNINTSVSSSESVSVATGAGAAGSIAGGGGGGSGGGGGATGSKRVMDEEEERDAVFYRLEMLGYRVGQGLVERCVLKPPILVPLLFVVGMMCEMGAGFGPGS